MSRRHIWILVNEQSMSISDGLTVGELRDRVKPDADVLVINGFPAQTDIHLKEGDKVVSVSARISGQRRSDGSTHMCTPTLFT